MNANGSLTNSTMWYWERSRYYDHSGGVCGVNGDGSATYVNYYSSGGLAPAFVIG
jgi:hypothetical protein